jgi:mono/diheme cytochrome c family protein
VKRLTNILQIVAVLLAAFFIVCLFTSQFPPWKSNSNGGQAAANTTVVSAGTTAAGGAATTAAGGGALTTAAGGAATTAAASTADGKALYEANCATCHGKTGGGGFGPSLKGVQNSFSEEEEAKIIKNGQGSMPGFSGQLTDAEIAAIVAYTRTLG